MGENGDGVLLAEEDDDDEEDDDEEDDDDECDGMDVMFEEACADPREAVADARAVKIVQLESDEAMARAMCEEEKSLHVQTYPSCARCGRFTTHQALACCGPPRDDPSKPRKPCGRVFHHCCAYEPPQTDVEWVEWSCLACLPVRPTAVDELRCPVPGCLRPPWHHGECTASATSLKVAGCDPYHSEERSSTPWRCVDVVPFARVLACEGWSISQYIHELAKVEFAMRGREAIENRSLLWHVPSNLARLTTAFVLSTENRDDRKMRVRMLRHRGLLNAAVGQGFVRQLLGLCHHFDLPFALLPHLMRGVLLSSSDTAWGVAP